MKKLISAILISAIFASATPAIAQTATTPGQVRRDAAKERLAQRREVVSERIGNLKERIATREAALKERLSRFKDKQKAQIIDRIGSVLNNINSNWVEHANRFLANLTRILDRLQEKVNSEAATGDNATSANAAIANAKAKIASASAAVASQSAMEYTVSISSESAAKAEIKSTRESFHSDWEKIRRMLIDARQAVGKAIETAATTLGGRNTQ